MHQECEEIAEQFFDNMDKLKDGRLTELDLLLQLNELDFNGASCIILFIAN